MLVVLTKTIDCDKKYFQNIRFACDSGLNAANGSVFQVLDQGSI